jgi:predicted ATP-dependent endonuclease of OLD family
MITALELKNFQVHKRLKLDLNHPITTIIGDSDHGKSAILRALHWVSLNRPSGCEFMNWGANDVSVRVVVDDKEVTRSSSNTTNLYSIGDKEYKAFGRDVPEDITKLLRISPLNFQGQHEAPFWFSLSPAEVSRQLNQIVNLELIDQTLSKLDSMLRNSRAVVAERRERVAEARTERKRLQFVNQMNEELVELQSLFTKANNAKDKAVQCAKQLEIAERNTQALETLRQALDDIQAPLVAGQLVEQLEKQCKGLAALVAEAGAYARTAGLTAPSMAQLGGLAQQAEQAAKQHNSLASLITTVESVNTGLITNREALQTIQTKMEQLAQGKCLLCGRPLS